MKSLKLKWDKFLLVSERLSNCGISDRVDTKPKKGKPKTFSRDIDCEIKEFISSESDWDLFERALADIQDIVDRSFQENNGELAQRIRQALIVYLNAPSNPQEST